MHCTFEKHITKYKHLSNRISPRQNNHSDFNELAVFDGSIILDMLFSAHHQYMYIYGASKNDKKTANVVYDISIYIVVILKESLSSWLHTWIIQQTNYEVAMVSSEHPRISSLYLLHKLQHCNGNPFHGY